MLLAHKNQASQMLPFRTKMADVRGMRHAILSNTVLGYSVAPLGFQRM